MAVIVPVVRFSNQGDRDSVAAADLEQGSSGRTSRVSTAQTNRSDALPAMRDEFKRE